MALDSEVPDHYYTFEGRLASFKAAQPVNRRRSTATKAKGPKSLSWPHKRLDAAALARAGFYFEPTPEFPDNVVCYLCQKRVGGWEDTDEPLEEHLRLSNGCGWAIVSAIEAGLGDYGADDPSNPDMMDARKQTFMGRWPHEGKRGWKCKVKQMVDAGWKYTPTPDSDDMATCTYCQLALDGWEPSDKPMDEHYKRSSNCPFFRLINQYQTAPAKKPARGKAARTSKASRLSAAPEAPSMVEQPDDYEDSVMANASVATVGGTKRARAKTTTAKGKKTRGKKDEPIEVLEDPPEEEQPPPKPTRGRKRASDSVDDSVLTNAEAPAPKKRATRTRQSNAVDTSSVLEDQTMLDAPAAKTTMKKGQTKARKPRKLSTASIVSAVEAPAEQIPDDDELDRQLQADLDRPGSDNDTVVQSDSEKKAPATKGKGKKAATKKNSATKEELSSDHAMFDPAPMEVDDDDLSAELTAMRMDVTAEEPEALQVPKKGRKAGTRKVSKQTKAQKAKQPVAEQEPELDASPKPEPEPVTVTKTMPAPADPLSEDELSFDATVLTTSSTAGPRKRGRPRKSSVQPVVQPVAPKGKPGRPSKVSRANAAEETRRSSIPAAPAVQSPVKEELPPAPADEEEPEEDILEEEVPHEEKEAPEEVEEAAEEQTLEEEQALEEEEAPEEAPEEEFAEEEAAEEVAEQEDEEVAEEEEEEEEVDEEEARPPATPAPVISPAPAAKQSAVSPSQSPQSSDAENQPPSSKPSNTANSSRVAEVPVAETPSRASPSKQDANYLHNLESTHPWQAVDLDLVFEDLNKENAAANPLLQKGQQQQQLTSPEKKMTVEEWIHHNAALAEGSLKNECEAMVSKFEQEGGRAMRVLEELVVE